MYVYIEFPVSLNFSILSLFLVNGQINDVTNSLISFKILNCNIHVLVRFLCIYYFFAQCFFDIRFIKIKLRFHYQNSFEL